MGKVDLKNVLEIRWDGPWEVRPIDVNVDFTLTPTCGQGNTTVSATPINQYSNDWGGKVEIFYYEYSDLVNTEIECVGVSDCEGGYVQYEKVESGSTVVGLIPASGGTATTTIGNGRQYYTRANGETGKTHDIIPCDISGNPMISFTATASSRGTEVGEEKVVSSTTVMWYGEDYKKVSGIVEVRQAENKAESVSTKITPGEITVATIPASGGSGTTIISNGKYDEVTTYSSNGTATTKSGGIVKPNITEFTAYADSLGLVTSQIREVSSTTVTWTKNGVSETAKTVVLQAANTFKPVDNEVVLSVSASTTSLANTKNAAAALTISGKIISGDLYESGQFSATSETNIPSSDIKVSIDNTTDFTLSGNTLLTAKANENIEINECIVTASYVLNGKTYSSSITIKQVGTPAKYNFNVLYNTQSVKDKTFEYENISGYTFNVYSTKSGESKTNGSFSEDVNWRLAANENSLVYINEDGQWVEYNGDFISAETVHVGEIQPKSTKSLWVKPILNNLTFTNNLSTILTFIQEGNNGGTVETRIMYDLTNAKLTWTFDVNGDTISVPWSGGTYDLKDSKCILNYTFVQNGTSDAKYVYTSDYSDSLILSLQRDGKYVTYSTVETIDNNNLSVTFSPNWCDNLSTQGQYGCGYDATLSLDPNVFTDGYDKIPTHPLTKKFLQKNSQYVAITEYELIDHGEISGETPPMWSNYEYISSEGADVVIKSVTPNCNGFTFTELAKIYPSFAEIAKTWYIDWNLKFQTNTGITWAYFEKQGDELITTAITTSESVKLPQVTIMQSTSNYDSGLDVESNLRIPNGSHGPYIESGRDYIRIGQQHQPYKIPISLGIVLGSEASKFWETYNQGNHSNSMGFKGKVGLMLTDGTNNQDAKATFDVLCRWEPNQIGWESIVFPNAVMCDLESLSFSGMQSCSIIDHGCAFYEGSGYTQSNIDMQYYLALVVDGECKSTIPGEGIARLCTLSTQGNVAFNDNLELYPTPYDTCSYLEVASAPFVEGSQVMLCVVISSMKNWDQAFSTGTTGTIVSSYE